MSNIVKPLSAYDPTSAYVESPIFTVSQSRGDPIIGKIITQSDTNGIPLHLTFR